jgi:anthranilate/para-aminobenzoate synthase component I
LADLETPLSAYRKIRGQGESFLFESVEGGEHIGRYSFVGCNPRAVIRQHRPRVEVIENGKVTGTASPSRPRPRPPAAKPVKDGLEGGRASHGALQGGGAARPAALHRRGGRIHRLRIYT